MEKDSICLNNKVVFITGVAGFIGANLVLEIVRMSIPITIIGIDNINDYYDISIKKWRLQKIDEAVGENSQVTWKFIEGDISNNDEISLIF